MLSFKYKNSLVRTFGLGTVSSAVAVCSALSFVAPQVAQAADGDFELEEIIVTATKRSESLQDVPISITAFGEAQLEAYRPANLEDLSGFVPNMYMPPAGERGVSTISIRGFGVGISRTSGKGVGVYIDGVYVGGNTAQNIEMADIARVEVLKGPQGTLFGRDTIGGAINITTKKPGNEFAGSVEAQTGNFGHVKLKANADIPLVEDTLTMRVAGLFKNSDGHILNEATGKKLEQEEVKSGHLQLYYTPSENFSARLSYTHVESDGRPASNGEPATNLFSDEVPYTVNIDAPQISTQNTDALSLSVEYEFASGHTLTSITGWSSVSDFYSQDVDMTPLSIFTKEYIGEEEEWSQELRLTSPENEKFDYLIGLYYFNGDYKLQDVFPLLGSSFLTAIGIPEAFHPTVDILDGQKRDLKVKSLAAFTHVNYHVTDDFTLFGGLRYTSDKKDTDYSMFGETFAVVGFATIDVVDGTKDDPISWALGARYAVTEDIMTYASVGRGFRSSSIKDYFVSAADLAVDGGFFTKPEFVTNYEVGVKLQAFDNKLRANVAAFYMDYTDIQTTISDPVVTFVRRYTNAAKATAKGFEADVVGVLSDRLQISGTLGYLTSEYDEYTPGPDLDFTGFTVSNTPEWTASAALDYNLPLGNGGQILAHADYRYASGPAGQLVPGTTTIVGGYGVVNAWAGYQSPDAKWNVSFWVENLFDANDPASSILWNSGFGPLLEHNAIRYERPRSYGVTLGYNF